MTPARSRRTAAPSPRQPAKAPPYVSPTVRDPGVCIADRWRVYQRTDGPYIVVDLQLMARHVVPATVSVHRSLDEATSAARELAGERAA